MKKRAFDVENNVIIDDMKSFKNRKGRGNAEESLYSEDWTCFPGGEAKKITKMKKTFIQAGRSKHSKERKALIKSLKWVSAEQSTLCGQNGAGGRKRRD